MKKILFVAIIILAISCGKHTADHKPITPKIYAKGKPQRITKKRLKAEYESIGRFTLTAYCPCEKCCGNNKGITATGTKAKAGHTIAVDSKIIPYGTKVYINGITYTAEDCGGGVKGRHIDVFFNTHAEALEFGRQTATVYRRKLTKYAIKHDDIKGLRITKHNMKIFAGKKSGKTRLTKIVQ